MYVEQGSGSTIPVPAAQDQIDSYLASNAPKKSDIFVVFIGANDAFFSENVTGSQIAGLVADQVAQLYQRGKNSVIQRLRLGHFSDLIRNDHRRQYHITAELP